MIKMSHQSFTKINSVILLIALFMLNICSANAAFKESDMQLLYDKNVNGEATDFYFYSGQNNVKATKEILNYCRSKGKPFVVYNNRDALRVGRLYRGSWLHPEEIAGNINELLDECYCFMTEHLVSSVDYPEGINIKNDQIYQQLKFDGICQKCNYKKLIEDYEKKLEDYYK